MVFHKIFSLHPSFPWILEYIIKDTKSLISIKCLCVSMWSVKMGKVRLGNFPYGFHNSFDKFLKPSLFSNLSLSISFFYQPFTLNSPLENLLYTKYLQLIHSLIQISFWLYTTPGMSSLASSSLPTFLSFMKLLLI